MATNITVYDLINYPDNGKTVTVSLKSVVPTGAFGDEKWVLNATTSATASGSASIQDSFANGYACGWSKSSSRVPSPMTISSTTNQLKVAIDEPTGLTGGITITLTDSTSAQTGDDIALDIETQIRAATTTGGAKDGNLSYVNARCVYEGGRFVIASGSIADSFTGSQKSAVRVGPAATHDASAVLGFDTVVESEEIALSSLVETYVTSAVTAATTVPVASATGLSIGDCIALKDTDGTLSYRYISGISGLNLTVNAAATVSQNTMVQLLRLQDPDVLPPSYLSDVDSVMRHLIELMARQINFA